MLAVAVVRSVVDLGVRGSAGLHVSDGGCRPDVSMWRRPGPIACRYVRLGTEHHGDSFKLWHTREKFQCHDLAELVVCMYNAYVHT